MKYTVKHTVGTNVIAIAPYPESSLMPKGFFVEWLVSINGVLDVHPIYLEDRDDTPNHLLVMTVQEQEKIDYLIYVITTKLRIIGDLDTSSTNTAIYQVYPTKLLVELTKSTVVFWSNILNPMVSKDKKIELLRRLILFLRSTK